MNKLKETIYKAKHNTDDIKVAMEKELGFGCEIVVSFPSSSHYFKRTVIDYLPADDLLYYDNGRELGIVRNVSMLYGKGKRKIFGTPITLEDVLRAVRKKCPSKITEGIDGTNYDEGEEKYARIGLRLLREWQLGKTLDEQSKETIKFLEDLLLK